MQLEEEIIKLTRAIIDLTEKLDLNTTRKEDIDRIIPVTEWNNYHSWPPIGGLRHMIFNAEENGIGCCIKKIGKRVLIIENEFLKWAKNHLGVNEIK